MSGIFGVFNRNNQRVNIENVTFMLDTISNWKPDDKDIWVNRTIALGHAMLWNTPESKYEHLPLDKETFVITMDARIDNREELIGELELPNRPLYEIGDSEFILAAYAKWGEECPKYLLGDFVFAIWDEKKQQLFCARDHIGIKPFYYYLDDDFFIFSNDIECLLAHPSVPKNFNDKTIDMFLKDYGIHTKRETFFKKICKLPAATTLAITSDNIHEIEYWSINNIPIIRFDTYEEYVNEFKKLYENAIDARIRTDFPIASHLSGGIDSSPIAVYASRKLKNQKIHAYNWINIPKNEEESEFEAWSYSRQIAEKENIIHNEFRIDPNYMVKKFEEHNIFTKGTMSYWEEYYVQDSLKSIGARILLSGWGGDELISHNGRSYLEGLYSQRKIFKFFKYLYHEKKYNQLTWKEIIKRFLKIILPHNIIYYLVRQNNNSSDESDYYNKYTTQKFESFMNKQQNIVFPNVLGVRKRQLTMFNYGHLSDRIESWALSSFSKRFEYRYPLLDKRIVEFAIAIPEEMFYPKKGKTRHLIKNAVTDLLSSEILWSDKPDEIKVNKSLKKAYYASYEIMKKKYTSKDCMNYNKEYIDCKKILKFLNSFDSKNDNPIELGNIVQAIMLLNSIKNSKFNN